MLHNTDLGHNGTDEIYTHIESQKKDIQIISMDADGCLFTEAREDSVSTYCTRYQKNLETMSEHDAQRRALEETHSALFEKLATQASHYSAIFICNFSLRQYYAIDQRNSLHSGIGNLKTGSFFTALLHFCEILQARIIAQGNTITKVCLNPELLPDIHHDRDAGTTYDLALIQARNNATEKLVTMYPLNKNAQLERQQVELLKQQAALDNTNTSSDQQQDLTTLTCPTDKTKFTIAYAHSQWGASVAERHGVKAHHMIYDDSFAILKSVATTFSNTPSFAACNTTLHIEPDYASTLTSDEAIIIPGRGVVDRNYRQTIIEMHNATTRAVTQHNQIHKTDLYGVSEVLKGNPALIEQQQQTIIARKISSIEFRIKRLQQLTTDQQATSSKPSKKVRFNTEESSDLIQEAASTASFKPLVKPFSQRAAITLDKIKKIDASDPKKEERILNLTRAIDAVEKYTLVPESSPASNSNAKTYKLRDPSSVTLDETLNFLSTARDLARRSYMKGTVGAMLAIGGFGLMATALFIGTTALLVAPHITIPLIGVTIGLTSMIYASGIAAAVGACAFTAGSLTFGFARQKDPLRRSMEKIGQAAESAPALQQ